MLQRSFSTWRLRDRTLPLGERTLVMAILNCTPDSFSEPSSQAPMSAPPLTSAQHIARGIAMLDQGAHILDIGGESTRPGSHAASEQAVPAQEEQCRILPVIQGILTERPGAVLSVDTYRASTARLAVEHGCQIVNDVSGLLWDPEMAPAVAELRCGLVLMHTRGRPDEWRTLPPLALEQVLPLVESGLRDRLEHARAHGIAEEAIALDPGYGLGKSFTANYPLLARQHELLALGRPLLAGVSRKSFLGRTLGERLPHLYSGKDAPPEARSTASVAALTAAVLRGASIVRVHEVRPALEAAAIADAILFSDPAPHSIS